MMTRRGNLMLRVFYGSLVWLYLHIDIVTSDIIQYDKSILEDANLPAPDLIRKYGYEAEIHKITTKDGFVLTAHRIPKPGAQPVLMVHGLEDSSVGYLILGPKKSLAYRLSDLGYDIWLLNTRGNRYSRKHKRYHRYMRQFWDFSFHEVGLYDLPATIDYVLAVTKGFQQLHYIGHSQGTTSFMVMGSERPSYMKKIKLMQALAPVVFCDYVESPFVLFASKYVRPLTLYARALGIYDFPPEGEVFQRLFYQICSFAFRNTCNYFLLQLMGVDAQQLNATLVPLFVRHVAGSSLKSLGHYTQLVHSGGFYKYDYYSTVENRRRHGSDTPPQYNLANVDCKVALYYSKNDLLTAVRDVERLRDALPNVVHDGLIPYEKFNHVDFIWANDVNSLLYDGMVEVMKRSDDGEL
ncbi:lipase 1 [Drosophila obscura]|uniref:lipase 1 n=1 Tax=Drosophila obscura TaxID=7282 RepID=UPI001BB0EB11|nr:lipase 1 [Drosophila obscura]XP_022228233.2 lipase 1 [Drosophila obscura]